LTANGGDAFISKLDSSGSFIWAKNLATTSWSYDIYSYSIAIDIWGFVYTTGYFNGTSDFDPGPGVYNMTANIWAQDIFISKLNSSGNFVWAKQFSGPAQKSATSLTVDYSGNVVTTGYFMDSVDFDPGPSSFNLGSSGYNDIFISELDAAGNFIWAGKIGGPSSESPACISLDAAGNIILTGNFGDTCDFDPGNGTFLLNGSSGSVFVSKLTASGNLMWAKQFGGPGSTSERINSHTINASGDIYTTGYFSGIADFNPDAGVYNLTALGNCSFTSRLNSSGSFDWAKSAGKGAGAYDKSMVTDRTGNVLTTGGFWGTVDFDPGPGIFNLTNDANEKDIFIYKSDASGNFLWAKQMNGTASDDYANAIAVDSLGDIYITGYFWGPVDFDPGNGLFILTPPGNSKSIFISKYNASGNFMWAKQINDTSSFAQYMFDATAITIDNAGKILVAGYFYGTVDFNPGPAVNNLSATPHESVFILKLDNSGNFIWVKKFGGNNGGGSVFSIATDPMGNVLTSGNFIGQVDFDPGASTFNLSGSGGLSVYISKLSSSGDFVWAKHIITKLVNNISGLDYSFSMTADSYGNVYSTGCFSDTVDFDPGAGVYNLICPLNNNIYTSNIYISKLDASGNFVWAKQFAGGNKSRCRSIAADVFGNVYTTGYFNSSSDFDPGPGTYYISSFNSSTAFISKLDTSGNFVWAKGLGGPPLYPTYTYGNVISVEKSGNIYTAGYNYGTCDFDTDSSGTYYISSVGNPDLFIHKLSQCPWASITPVGPVAFCTGGNALLNANTGTGFNYQWKKNGNNISGATSPAYTVTTSGNYSVVVNSPCGSAISPVVTVTVNSLPSATITAGGPTTFCSGSSVVLNAPPGANYSYQWKKGGVNIPGATNSNYTATTAGTYKVTVTNTSTGCSKTTATGTIVTVNALPAATISPSGTIIFCAGQSALLTANPGPGYSYQWRKNHSAVNGATSQAYTVTTAGKYRVQVTDNNGCVKLSYPDTVVVPCKTASAYTQDENEFDVKIFPNPSSGEFVFEIRNSIEGKISIHVYDMIGKLILSGTAVNSPFTIYNSQLPSGIYSAEIIWRKNPDGSGQVKKVLKLIKTE